jgi:UDP-glucose 4-epimerase
VGDRGTVARAVDDRVDAGPRRRARLGERPGRFREDVPLPITPADPIPVLKKSAELFGSPVADRTGIDVVSLRISTICGPLRQHHEPPFAALPALVRGGAGPPARPVHARGGRDVCYVKDAACGLALLQLADHLSYRTYNMADRARP